jgi:hypothetical protein
MTLNAMLTYLGVALSFSAAAFIVLAIRRPQDHLFQKVELSGDVLQNIANAAIAVRRRTNAYCSAILLAVAVIAEVVSIVRGGPAIGELSGNVYGGFLAIFLATFACLIACLVARHFIMVHLCRRLKTHACAGR